MLEETLQPCAYHVVRYQPNLIRDEWVNIGVLVLDPSSGRVRQRWLDEPADLARLRRMHPAADEELLLRLPAEFDRQFAGREMDAAAILEKFDETLSNALQLSPRKGVLARDPDAELDRIFREQVEPVREGRRDSAEIRTRSDLRAGRRLFPERKNSASHGPERARCRVYLSGRSHAHRFFVPPQWHARLRAFGAAGARSWPGETARVYRGCHSRPSRPRGVSCCY
jgi:hypothetical protein